jgi:hypothetical protein
MTGHDRMGGRHFTHEPSDTGLLGVGEVLVSKDQDQVPFEQFE